MLTRIIGRLDLQMDGQSDRSQEEAGKKKKKRDFKIKERKKQDGVVACAFKTILFVKGSLPSSLGLIASLVLVWDQAGCCSFFFSFFYSLINIAVKIE